MPLTNISPTAGTGIGPHPITVTGTGLLTTPNVTRIVMKDAGGATVGQSALGTATATAFTKPVTFELFTPSGTYTAWLVQNNIASQVPGTPFTLTRTAPTVPAGTPPGFGVFDRRFGLPNYRGRG
jgi:hypothetical protein